MTAEEEFSVPEEADERSNTRSRPHHHHGERLVRGEVERVQNSWENGNLGEEETQNKVKSE